MKLCACGCGKEIEHKAYHKYVTPKYISGHNLKGRICSEKTREKIRKSNKGKFVSEETRIKQSESHKGHIPWNKGKIGVCSKEVIKKISESLKDVHKNPDSIYNSSSCKEKKSKVMKGRKYSKEHRRNIGKAKERENNPNWRGGISCEPYCEQWSDQEYKESIKQRDGYKCLNPECNKTSDKLCIHHIDYVKKNCHPLNLITICISCNSKANKDRKWHKAWYQAIIYRRYKDKK